MEGPTVDQKVAVGLLPGHWWRPWPTFGSLEVTLANFPPTVGALANMRHRRPTSSQPEAPLAHFWPIGSIPSPPDVPLPTSGPPEAPPDHFWLT